MRSRLVWLSLALLLLSPLCSFSDAGIPRTELIAALGRISQGLEIASERQDEISAALETASTTLSRVVEELLPNIDQQVKSQQDSFDAYVAKEERDDALMMGATAAALLIAILALVL